MNEHYVAVLADLKQMKADAEAGIAAIERLVSRGGQTQFQFSPPIAQPIPVTTISDAAVVADEAGIPDRVLEIFTKDPGRVYDTERLAALLGSVNIKTLRGALSRLSSGDNAKLKRLSRGKYTLRMPEGLSAL